MHKVTPEKATLLEVILAASPLAWLMGIGYNMVAEGQVRAHWKEFRKAEAALTKASEDDQEEEAA